MLTCGFCDQGKENSQREKKAESKTDANDGKTEALSYNFADISVHTPDPAQNTHDSGFQGMKLPTEIRSRYETMMHADFSGVRFFPGRPDVTVPLKARAVTRGQNIYFHAGQFHPETFSGDMLIAHELAHTMQLRAADSDISVSGKNHLSQHIDSLERNAEAIAEGKGVSILSAQQGVALRLPLDTETSQERVRRERLVQSISSAINNLVRLLQTGGLVQNSEAAHELNGVQGVSYYPGSGNLIFESLADRNTRLQRIMRSLIAMGRQYRSAQIPTEFGPPVQMPAEAGGGYQSAEYTYTVGGRQHSSSALGGTAAWADLQGAYTRYAVTHGQHGSAYREDWLFLNPNIRIIPGALHGAPRTRRGIQTGLNIVVPDIEHNPLHYWRLSGFERIPRGSVIVELWRDSFGYYYMYRSQRIDIPDYGTY